jgi:hypothetical protein
MRWRAFVTVLFLGRIVMACRTECQADVQASKEQVAREQKAFDRGREGGICKELAYPRLALTDDRLLLKAIKENEIGHRSDVAEDKLAPVEPLEARLRMYRDHFRLVRAAEVFQPVLYVTLDPQLSTTRAANILRSAARAGYTESRLYVGDERELAIQSWAPPRESSTAAKPHNPMEMQVSALCVESSSDAAIDIYFDGAVATSTRAATINALPEALAKHCEGVPYSCAYVVAIRDAGKPIRESVKLARAILDSPTFAGRERQPRLTFAADRGNSLCSLSRKP